MYNLLVSIILTDPSSNAAITVNSDEKAGSRDEKVRQRATFLVSLHLFSPLVFTISTRGSSESVLSLFVLSTLYYALLEKWDLSAVLLGLSTHWKIYPFIYGVACLGVIGSQRGVGSGWAGWVWSVVNARTVRFGVISGTTFVVLGAAMYAM